MNQQESQIAIRLDRTTKEAAKAALDGRSMSWFIRMQLQKLIEGGVYDDRSFSR